MNQQPKVSPQEVTVPFFAQKVGPTQLKVKTSVRAGLSENNNKAGRENRFK